MAALADRQHGVVSTRQLRAIGMQPGAIKLRVQRRRLHPVHRGVYAVGHARLTWRAHAWAAVLACGGDGAAVLSHKSAAAVWDLTPVPSGRVDITTLRQSRSTAALRVHRSRTLDARRHVVRRDGLPVTTVARTLVDLADVVSPHRLERLCHRAEVLRILDAGAISDVLATGRRTTALQRALATLALAEPQITRNDFEEAFLSLVARFDLPRPLVNTVILGHEVDFAWPEQRLIVETDGRGAHLRPTAFESDRRRDVELKLAGYEVLRFTWRQLTGEPEWVAETVRTMLRRGQTAAASA